MMLGVFFPLSTSVKRIVANDWDDFFDINDPATNITNSISSDRIESRRGNTHVYDCQFIKTNGGNGGGIYVYDETRNVNLLVERTALDRCSAKSYGGAIWFQGGNYVLKGVCAFSSFAKRDSQFDKAVTQPKSDFRIEILDSTIYKCNKEPNIKDVIHHENGNIKYHCINVSQNTAKANSAINAFSPKEPDKEIDSCSIEYSTFCNNTSQDFACIYIGKSPKDHTIRKSNILYNENQRNEDYGLVFVEGSTIVEDCCILFNKADCIIQKKNYGTLVLIHTTIDLTDTKIIGKSNDAELITDRFVNKIDCLDSYVCKAQYDVIDNEAVKKPIVHITKRHRKKRLRISIKMCVMVYIRT